MDIEAVNTAITAEQVKAAIEAAVPGSRVEMVPNGSPSGQHSLVLDNEHAVEAARFLRDDPKLRLDFCSDVAGVDWLDSEVTEKVKVKKVVDGVETEVEEIRKTVTPGYLEAVYHLFSMSKTGSKKHEPVVLRLRTRDRGEGARVPSMTPVWRSAEFQEREAFDLYGIVFEGHPDLRRILMWNEFKDSPMRKDYVAPVEDDEPVTAAREGEQ